MSEPEPPALSPDAVPRACTTTDRAAEFSPEEGFILAHIDGVTPVRRLVELSSLPPERTLAVLNSLAAKDAIVILDPAAARAGECDADSALRPETAVDLVSLRQILRQALPKGDALVPIIESIFVNLEQLSYYELLGISGSEGQVEIRKAYLQRTKSFHPDRFYRRGDRQFRDRVQEIFKQLNRGYNVVTDPDGRAQYDKTLGLEQTGEGSQAELEEEVIEVGPRSSRLRGVKGQSPWKQIRVPKRKPFEEDVKKPPRPAPEPKPTGPKLKLGLKDGKSPSSPLMKKIMALKKAQGKEGGDATAEQAERLYKGAMTEAGRGNFGAARINLRLAIQYAPANHTYKAALADLEKGEEKQKAEFDFQAGLDAHKEGNLQGAARHYRAALQAGLENAKLFHKLAQLLMELENNHERARTMVLKAIEMEPGVSEFHITLARAYKGLGQNAASIMQLEKALKLDPGNKVLAKEVKSLKRG